MKDSLGIDALLYDDDGWSGCPCGTGERYFGEGTGARTRHARWHLEWDRGAAMPSSMSWGDSLLIVGGESSMPDRKLAYTLGRLFQREQRYDFPMAPDPKHWRGQAQEVLIAVYRRRAVGMLLTGPTMRYGVWDGSPGSIAIDIEATEPLPEVSGVWVCRENRRRGVGRALVNALGDYANLLPADLVWGLPFSDDGKALAARVSGFPMRVC